MSMRRRLIQLSLPLVGANLAQTALSVADTAMVGHLGQRSLAAMGPPNVFFLVLFLMSSAGYMGVQALTARRFGAKRFSECGRILDHGLVLAVFTGLVVGGLGIVFARPLSEFLVEDQAVSQLSGDYLIVRWGGVIGLIVLWTMKGFYFGVGITRLDLFVSLSMNGLNIFLNWLLLWGHWGFPELGLGGAAWGSAISTGLAALIYLLHASRPAMRERYAHFRFRGFSLDQAKSIVRLSAPRAVAGLAFGGSILFFKLIGDHASEAHLAASTALWRLMGVTVLVSIAIGSATASIVGHELGAGRPEKAAEAGREAVKIGACASAFLGTIGLVFPAAIMRVFTSDEVVIATAIPALRLLSVFVAIDAGGIILARLLSSAGCVLYVMTMEIVCSIGCMLTAAWFLVRTFPDNLAAIWLSWVVYMVTWFLAMATKFCLGGWKTKVI